MLEHPKAVIGAAATTVLAAAVVAVVDTWSPEAWAALAGWITAAIAAAAGYIALGQLGEAQRVRLEQERLRLEQAQPYVVAYIEPNESESFLIELVVRNFGATAAHEVQLDITPKPVRAIDKGEHQAKDYVWLPERIPVLVPGQEWRTLWDSGMSRANSDLPDHHDAIVTFRDSQGAPYTTRAVLDWRMVFDRETVTVYSSHHTAKALREISKAIASWKEGPGGGLSVWTRDGDAKDEERQRRRAAQLLERAARDAAEDGTPESIA